MQNEFVSRHQLVGFEWSEIKQTININIDGNLTILNHKRLSTKLKTPDIKLNEHMFTQEYLF